MTSPKKLDEMLSLADRVVAMAQKGGVTTAECVVRHGTELSTKIRLGEVELLEEAGTMSAGLRVMRDQRVASTSTSDLSESGIARFVADAVELAELSQEDKFAGPADSKLLCDPKAAPDLDLFDAETDAIDAKQAIGICQRAERAARDFDARITNSEGASFGRTTGGSAISLSNGFRATNRGSYQSLSVVPVADDENNKKRRGYYWTAKRHRADLEDPAKVGAEAARRTLRKLGARSVPTGEYPIVFDPDAARAMLGIIAGCVMGSSIWRKSSYLIGKEGEKIAADNITIVDDPLIKRGPGSRAFDGEGLASRKNLVVENGVLRMYLCDSYSARKLGRESTGNASRGGGAGVGCSTTNFVLSPGPDSPEAILKGTKQGLYVTDMMGFGFNATTGDFSRGASGFWIENGELTYPVSEVTISLSMNDFWHRIDALGNDLDFRSSTVAPTMRVARMTVAGSVGS